MATGPMNKIVQQIRRAVLLQDDTGLTDGQLLKCFIDDREDAAFAVLVRRHGPMVWGVCRRVLNQDHDAEDAFQATFMVLVKKAASIKSHELLGNWLYGVANLTARKARALKMKRHAREKQMDAFPEPLAAQENRQHDLRPVLDGELSRLPEKYRIPVVLCDLEGKTRAEAARQIGCPEGTVAGRLARAREMLARRLTRRGVAVTAAVLSVSLAKGTASAAVPASAVASTVKAASLIAAGRLASEVLSAKVAMLVQGVLRAMLFTKAKFMLLLAGTVLLWGSAVVYTVSAWSGGEGSQAHQQKPANVFKKSSETKKNEANQASQPAPDDKRPQADDGQSPDGPVSGPNSDDGKPKVLPDGQRPPDGPGPHPDGPGFGPPPGKGPPPNGPGPRPPGPGQGPGRGPFPPGPGPRPPGGPEGPGGPGGKDAPPGGNHFGPPNGNDRGPGGKTY